MLPVGTGMEKTQPTQHCWEGEARWRSMSEPYAHPPGPIPCSPGFPSRDTEGAVPAGTATHVPIRGHKSSTLWPSQPGDHGSHREGHAGTLWPICHRDDAATRHMPGLSWEPVFPGWYLPSMVIPETLRPQPCSHAHVCVCSLCGTK